MGSGRSTLPATSGPGWQVLNSLSNSRALQLDLLFPTSIVQMFSPTFHSRLANLSFVAGCTSQLVTTAVGPLGQASRCVLPACLLSLKLMSRGFLLLPDFCLIGRIPAVSCFDSASLITCSLSACLRTVQFDQAQWPRQSRTAGRLPEQTLAPVRRQVICSLLCGVISSILL